MTGRDFARLRSTTLTVLFAATLSACTTQPKVAEYTPSAATCCSSLSALPYRTMPLGQELELSLTPHSPTYDFSGKRQHVVALKIPDGFSATTLQVRTYLSGVFIWNMSALVPEFVFLDQNHKIIGTRPTESFQRATGFWRSGVSGTVSVPAGARYFVVKPGDGSAGVPAVYSDHGTPGKVNPAAVGDFSLRIFGEQQK
jgi:hypothetical protein